MLKSLHKSPALISLVITIITLAAFWPVLTGDFVMWDDDRMIYKNQYLQGLSIDNLAWIFSHADITRRYTPLAALNYSITYHLCGLNPFGYHLSAWLFHGLSAAILFFILRILLTKGLSRQNKKIEPASDQFLGRRRVIIMVSASSADRTCRLGRSQFLSSGRLFRPAFRFMLSLGAQGKYNFRFALSSHPWLGDFVALALLSHPIVIGVFAVFIALDIYPLKTLSGKWFKSRKALLEKMPFLIVVLVIAAFTVLIRLNDIYLDKVPLYEFGILERIMQAFYIWAYYIWRPHYYPLGLMPSYSTLISFDPLSPPFILSALGVTGLIITLIYSAAAAPAYLHWQSAILFCLYLCLVFLNILITPATVIL